MIRTYTYKLYNNKSYLKKYDEWIGICRYVYNLTKQTKEDSYKAGLNLTGFDLAKQLTECKKEFKWLNTVSSQTLQSVVERVEISFKNFYRNNAKYPKWAKKGKYNSFKFKQGIKQTEKGFNLPKFGNVKVFNNRKIDGKIKGAILLSTVKGLELKVIVEEEERTINSNKNQVGIDMGISYFLVTSDGEFVENPRHLDKYLKQLRIENRKLSRKKKGSNNFKKQVKCLRRIHLKIKSTRLDFLHKTSTKLSKENSIVYLEDLNIIKMLKNSNYSQSISDVGWGKFTELLSYKTNIIKVNPSYTSQMCNKCGSIDKDNRKTQSEFKCLSCGNKDNADLNASKNIKKLGHELMYVNVGQ